MGDTISRQAAIDALDGNVVVTSKESAQAVMDYIRGCADRIRSLPSAQPDITLESAIGFLHDIGWMQKHDEEMTTSAYTEGYIAAESKYRKMWDEMQANIKEKAFGKRKGLVHTADIDAMPTIEPERKKMSNKEWVDFLSEQFTVSHTSAREMLHGLMRWKAEDNFKKQFNGGKNEKE